MAKTKTVYRCTECGADYSKWQGRCDTCGGWNTLVEEAAAPRITTKGGGSARRMGGSAAMGEGGQRGRRAAACATCRARNASAGARGSESSTSSSAAASSRARWCSWAASRDRQVDPPPADRRPHAAAGRGTLYVSGEESPLQVKLRADRLDEPAGDVACSARRFSRR
jgi:DNA repair protein RadA/Sms